MTYCTVAIRSTALLAVLLAMTACRSSPLNPSDVSLAGRWVGTLANPNVGPGCLGDCSIMVLTLDSEGGGDVLLNDGKRFAVTHRIDPPGRLINLVLPRPDVYAGCAGVGFRVRSVERSGDSVVAFSGSLLGRCCNTLTSEFRFTKR